MNHTVARYKGFFNKSRMPFWRLSRAPVLLAFSRPLLLSLSLAMASVPLAVGHAATPAVPVMNETQREATIQSQKAARSGQWVKASELARSAGSPLAVTLYEWSYLTNRSNDATFGRVANFVTRHPSWPKINTILYKAERVLPDDMPDDQVIAWFGKYPPQTEKGVTRYLRALQRAGDRTRMQSFFRDWWSEKLVDAQAQANLLRNFGGLLDNKAHVRRINALLQAKHYTNARRLAAMIGKGYPALVEARIALIEDQDGVNAVIASVPAELRNDPGLVYERIRWRRRHNLDFEAIELLHRSSPPVAQIPNPDAWWQERHILIRRLLEKKQYQSAYHLAAGNPQTEGVGFADAQFMAGWLALRFLNKPWAAFEHFEKLYNGVSTPISRARGAYWAGRASEALNHPEVALEWYKLAADQQTTYYGQLAYAHLPPNYKPPMQTPPKRDIGREADFYANELVQAAYILHKAGYRDDTTAFLDAMARTVTKPDEYLYLAEFAERIDHLHNAIRISKEALSKNVMIMDHAYPTMISTMKGVKTEWALVHAIIRQESAFNYAAISPAGARGLMQLMPGTAAEVARKLGVAYQQSWLIERPRYNIDFGAFYIQDMINRFGGSYPLAVAAYNGGPGRVGQWLGTFGDPRKGEIDMVDWIELIPVYETRNYVQRVLENVYLYRIKLDGVQESSMAPIHVSTK